jgi:hypothetical protein
MTVLVLGYFFTEYDHRRRISLFCEGVAKLGNELQASGEIPLLASPQGGVAASSRKFREATEVDAAGVVFLLF